jgi:hypothetical protein
MVGERGRAEHEQGHAKKKRFGIHWLISVFGESARRRRAKNQPQVRSA